ncbi:MAG: hypothetical protein LBP50_07775 [Tannerella sp.]|jgi:hypothetical protein|nr:hypothetical protein [Tannerella sp.]
MKFLYSKKTVQFIIAVCAVMFSANTAFAQECSSVTLDGSLYDIVFSWKKKRVAVESHWAGPGFAFSNLRGLPDAADLIPERSYSVSLNVEDREIPIHPHWLLVSGIGFDWTRFHFGGNVSLQNKGGHTDFFYDDRTYKDSKLLVYYGKIPLLLEYQTHANGKTFYMQGGVEGLVKLYSKSCIEVNSGKGIDREEFRNLKILPVNMRLFLHVGFSKFGVFGYYQPFSMFQQRRGPDLRSFGAGISLN